MPNKEQAYSLNCERCGAVYQSTEGFPEPQLCPKCSLIEKCKLTLDEMKDAILAMGYKADDEGIPIDNRLRFNAISQATAAKAIPIIAEKIKKWGDEPCPHILTQIMDGSGTKKRECEVCWQSFWRVLLSGPRYD